MTPLLLAPGLGADERMFEAVRAQMPDWAASVADCGGDARTETVEAIAAACLERAPERFVAVGHSFGAYVGCMMAALAPERCVGLALINAGARAETPSRRRLRAARMRDIEAGGWEAGLAGDFRTLAAAQNAHAQGLAGLHAAMGRAVGADVALRQHRAAALRADARPILAHYSGPVLALGGAQDRLVPPSLIQEVADVAQHGAWRILEACGHFAPLEQPSATAAALCDWLARAA